MSRHRPPRNKPHKPRPWRELVTAIATKLVKIETDFMLPNPEHIEQMSTQLDLAVQRLKFGKVQEQDLLNLQDAVNVALKLITDDNFADALIHTRAAEHALVMIDERKTVTGHWVAKASELDAIEAFLPLHDAILANCPHIEIENATKAVKRDLEAV